MDSEFTPIVRRLGHLRAVSTLTRFGLAVEIGDWTRFADNSTGAFIGLISAKHSSGQYRSLESITNTGNGHARRLLIEAVWHHKRSHHVGPVTRGRWAPSPPLLSSYPVRSDPWRVLANPGSA